MLSLIKNHLYMEENHMRMFRLISCVYVFMLFGVIQAYAIDQAICDSGSKVVLYPNGSLMSCSLKSDFHSNEITCKEKNPISFYDNGQLETCNLAGSTKAGGQECKEFTPISFYPDGKFRSCVKTN